MLRDIMKFFLFFDTNYPRIFPSDLKTLFTSEEKGKAKIDHETRTHLQT